MKLPVLPRSSLPGIVWPTLPEPAGSAQLAFLYQLEQSETWSPEYLATVQFRQLSELLSHAWKTAPFYRARLKAAGYVPGSIVTPEWFSRLPFLTRQDLQTKFPSIRSALPPPQHGQLGEGSSSGSTGRPVQYLTSEHTRTIWRTLTLRDHLWNRRDFGSKVAVIRPKVPNGTSPNWGPAVANVYTTAPIESLHIMTPLHEQVQWLMQQNPEYVLTTPSNLRGLADEMARLGGHVDGLKEIVTMGEALPPDERSFCEATFKAPIRDMYSASEVGYIALQCAEGHYHVQETLLVEILDEAGQPVAPGQIGKIVITDLHNFALPMIRYSIGDYAEAGEFGCACGRSLRRLNRIMGRTRNLFTLPGGLRFWPVLPFQKFSMYAEITRHQVVQKTLDTLELRLEIARPLTPEEKAEITEVIQTRFKYPFMVNFVEMANMPLNENGKFEDFLSLVTA